MKKYYFRAKLLEVEVYYTLIAFGKKRTEEIVSVFVCNGKVEEAEKIV